MIGKVTRLGLKMSRIGFIRLILRILKMRDYKFLKLRILEMIIQVINTNQAMILVIILDYNSGSN